ncbi:MAG: hypothetical protein R3F21_13155 [Myxococcota bacterium]
MPLLQTPLVKRIPLTLLGLIGLVLGVGLTQPATALEVGCGGGGCVGGGLDFKLGESPNLHLAGSYTVYGRNPLGFGATVVGDLLQSAGANGSCHSANGRSLCVSPSTRSNQVQLFGVRIHFGSGSQFDDWRFGVRPIAPNPGPVVTHPGGITNPIPEPSAALIFGVGLLVASGLVTRTGSID